MQYIVDRIEGDFLVLENEDEQFFSVPKGLIPGAKEGDCITISIDPEETKKRQENIRRLMEELFKD